MLYFTTDREASESPLKFSRRNCTMKTKTINRPFLVLVWEIVIVVLLFGIVAHYGVSILNGAETEPTSACSISNKGLEKPAKELLKLRCDLEKAELKRRIRDAEVAMPPPPVILEVGPIGVASKNRSVTTVTYRDETGRAFEGSAGWAKHEQELGKIQVKLEKAKNPSCGWACQFFSPAGPGYGYAGPGYSGGGVNTSSGYGYSSYGGYVQGYNPPGGYHRR